MSNKQTRRGASIKLVPMDNPRHGAYPPINCGLLPPPQGFSLRSVEHRFCLCKSNFRQCLKNKLEGVPAYNWYNWIAVRAYPPTIVGPLAVQGFSLHSVERSSFILYREWWYAYVDVWRLIPQCVTVTQRERARTSIALIGVNKYCTAERDEPTWQADVTR